MKVKALIEELQKYDPEEEVYLYNRDYGTDPVEEVGRYREHIGEKFNLPEDSRLYIG